MWHSQPRHSADSCGQRLKRGGSLVSLLPASQRCWPPYVAISGVLRLQDVHAVLRCSRRGREKEAAETLHLTSLLRFCWPNFLHTAHDFNLCQDETCDQLSLKLSFNVFSLGRPCVTVTLCATQQYCLVHQKQLFPRLVSGSTLLW